METENVNIITTFNFQQQNKNVKNGGLTLYEQVLSKNFQVIENLLKKLNQIYSHQQQYESSLTLLSQKMQKLQIDNQNIHHEFRTSHFMIDKKLNSIVNQYSNIVQDVSIIKKQLSLDNVGIVLNPVILEEQEQQQANHSQRNSKISRFKQQKRASIIKNSPQTFFNKRHINLIDDRNQVNVKKFQQQNLGKFLSQIEKSKNKEIIQIDQFQDPSQTQIEVKKKQQKKKKTYKKNVRPSIDNAQFEQKEIESLKSYVTQQLIKFNENSQQLKKIGELGINKYIKQQNLQIEEKVKQNENKIQVFQKEIIQKNDIILEQVKTWNKQCLQQMNIFKNYTQEIQKQQQNQFQALKKIIDQKVSQDHFNSHLDGLNKKIQHVIKNSFQTFAQKKETKRAIMFLQKKLNKIIQAQKRFNLQKTIENLDHNTKCLSCNKSNSFQNYHPMLAQVHLANKPVQIQEVMNFVQNNSNIQLEKTQRFNRNTQKNLNQNFTRHEIQQNMQSTTTGFQKKRNCDLKLSESCQKNNDLKENTTSSGKFFKQFKKQKNQISLKAWKQKAGSILKKQNSSLHFRSKSTYKR